MKTKQFTVKEFAAQIGFDYVVANALIQLLVHSGAAKEIGKRAQTGGRGKPSTVYDIPNEFEWVIWQDETGESGENRVEAVEA